MGLCVSDHLGFNLLFCPCFLPNRQRVVEAGRVLRFNYGVATKIPVREVKIVCADDSVRAHAASMEPFIKEVRPLFHSQALLASRVAIRLGSASCCLAHPSKPTNPAPDHEVQIGFEVEIEVEIGAAIEIVSVRV